MVEYMHDIMDRVTNISWRTTSGATLGGFQYEYDAAGRIVSRSRSRANLPNRCCRQIDRIAYRAFYGKQWMDREGRAATTRNTYCGNLLWQSSLTLLAHEDGVAAKAQFGKGLK